MSVRFRPSLRTRLFVMGLAAGATISAAGWAEPTDNDRNIAQSLFEQGRRLMEKGDYAAACGKFAESERLDPAGGTLMNLGLCHEKEGKLASAWADFKAALSAARKDKRADRAAAAEEHIAALEPRLPKLTVSVAQASPGEAVLVDGSPLGAEAWGSPVSLDPGTHTVAARAPRKKEWTTTVKLTASTETPLSVPALEPSTDGASAAPPEAEKGAPESAAARDATPPSGNGRATTGWIIGGAGVAALGVGTFFGVETLSKRHDSNAQCKTDTTCTAEGVKLNDQAKTDAWIADFGIGLGIVGLALGGYFLLTTGGDAGAKTGRPTTGVHFDASAGPGAAGVRMRGTW